MLSVQFRQSPFEIIVDQRDGQVGSPLHDANAERTKAAPSSFAPFTSID